METDTLVAIIVAISSLIVAIISLITSIITNRQSALSSQKLEVIKHALGQQSVTETFRDKEFALSLEALTDVLQSIQRLKDEMQLIITAVDRSLTIEIANQRFAATRAEVFDDYEKHYMRLNQGERQASHKAKNLALHAEKLLNSVSNCVYASEINTDVQQRLSLIRFELGDVQQLIRDSRTNRLVERFQIAI